MEITGRVTMTRDLYARIVRAAMRRHFLAYRVLGLCLLATGVFAVVRGEHPQLGLTMLLGAAVTLPMPWLTVRTGARKLRLDDNPVWTYRVSPAGITQTNPIAELSIRWDTVARRTESAVGWALKLSAGGVVVLPKEAFDPVDLPGIAELVAADDRPRAAP